MFSVEFIFKKSVYNDIIDNWKALNKKDDTAQEAGFVFQCQAHPIIADGVIQIHKDAHIYIYNLSDFYRVKITKE